MELEEDEDEEDISVQTSASNTPVVQYLEI